MITIEFKLDRFWSVLLVSVESILVYFLRAVDTYSTYLELAFSKFKFAFVATHTHTRCYVHTLDARRRAIVHVYEQFIFLLLDYMH